MFGARSKCWYSPQAKGSLSVMWNRENSSGNTFGQRLLPLLDDNFLSVTSLPQSKPAVAGSNVVLRVTATSPNPSLRVHTILREEFQIETPVFYWPEAPQRMLRISAQAYNSLNEYERLADALEQVL